MPEYEQCVRREDGEAGGCDAGTELESGDEGCSGVVCDGLPERCGEVLGRREGCGE
jgi:hypothetical protein